MSHSFPVFVKTQFYLSLVFVQTSLKWTHFLRIWEGNLKICKLVFHF
jgi:hypothetical protein